MNYKQVYHSFIYEIETYRSRSKYINMKKYIFNQYINTKDLCNSSKYLKLNIRFSIDCIDFVFYFPWRTNFQKQSVRQIEHCAELNQKSKISCGLRAIVNCRKTSGKLSNEVMFSMLSYHYDFRYNFMTRSTGSMH